jgi:AcrR family transcriptional regulator
MPPARRRPLSRDRVLATALVIADADGIDALSMRRLGQVLRVEAMSLYKHVAGKEAILDGMTELVMAEVEVPSPDLPWREALRRGATSTHAALVRHPWAAGVLESRLHPGPLRLRYLDAMVGVMRGAGFAIEDCARAFMALDALVYGHALQLASFPFTAEDAPQVAERMSAEAFEGVYPNLVAMAAMAAKGPGAVPLELDFGLDILLDGLERHLAAAR